MLAVPAGAFLNHPVTVSNYLASILGVRITKVFMRVVRSHRWPPWLTQTGENRRFQCVRCNGLVCL